MDLEIDLRADLNAQDDDGNGWSLLSDARDPSQVAPPDPSYARLRSRRGRKESSAK